MSAVTEHLHRLQAELDSIKSLPFSSATLGALNRIAMALDQIRALPPPCPFPPAPTAPPLPPVFNMCGGVIEMYETTSNDYEACEEFDDDYLEQH
jgi:hypothetical protein